MSTSWSELAVEGWTSLPRTEWHNNTRCRDFCWLKKLISIEAWSTGAKVTHMTGDFEFSQLFWNLKRTFELQSSDNRMRKNTWLLLTWNIWLQSAIMQRFCPQYADGRWYTIIHDATGLRKKQSANKNLVKVRCHLCFQKAKYGADLFPHWKCTGDAAEAQKRNVGVV